MSNEKKSLSEFMNVSEMVRELEGIYEGDQVEAVRMGNRYGFYLFEGSNNTGQLLCSDLLCRVFIELEISDINDKTPLYGPIQDEAMSHGFEPTREKGTSMNTCTVRLPNGMHLVASAFGESEIAIDVVREDGSSTPVAVVGNYPADGDDENAVHILAWDGTSEDYETWAEHKLNQSTPWYK